MKGLAAIMLCAACGSHAIAGDDVTDAAPPDADLRPRAVVLVHGLDGFENIGPISYFYGVKDALAQDGVVVYTPALDAYNSSDARGAELLAYVEGLLEPRVDLVCHSQGGLDCRYVASVAPERVAHVITIAAPHRGTPLADIALQDVQGPAQDAMNALLDLLGATISGTSDENAHAAMTDLSAAGAADFTRRHPDSPEVAYYSIAGRSGLTVADGDCTPDLDAPFVSRWTGSDPLDPILGASGVILDNALAGADAHDGLVPVASSRWGTFLGCVPADHMDEICQIAGDNPGTDFDCVGFYRDLVAWLSTLE